MTIAVCYQCGSFKHGAWTKCQKCGTVPAEDDDIVLSLAMTDHHFDKSNLANMGQQIATGERIKLDPQTHQNLLKQIHAPEMAFIMRMLKGGTTASKRSWWKFW